MPVNIKGLLFELKQGLAEVYGSRLKAVYLFGSYARGDYDTESDVDVLIVLTDYQSYGQEIDRTGELMSGVSLEHEISLSRVIMTEEQWQDSGTPFLRNVRAEARPA